MGACLLRAAGRQAARRGAGRLVLDATLNAVPFDRAPAIAGSGGMRC
jgi:hypothetical protein